MEICHQPGESGMRIGSSGYSWSRLWIVVALAGALPASALAQVQPPQGQQQRPAPRPFEPTQPGVHDPVIIKEGDTYYVFATGNGTPIIRSKDLVTWERAGQIFAETPSWIATAVPNMRGRSLWAPDVSYWNGKYHVYYSASSFGSQQSAIGLVTNVTLDSTRADYKWEDQGMVIQSITGVSTFNAIDPNLVFDENGVPWLNWGSFWGGIKMKRLDAATGKPSTEDTTLYSLAARAGTEATSNQTGGDHSIEGPFIVRRGDYFYLFVSFDRCCRGLESTYNVRVGRSAKVTGPYVDADGKVMTEGGGTLVLGTTGRVIGPGHNSILIEGDQYYLVHHFYDGDDNGRSKLQIRPLTWADGWPRAGEPLAPAPPRAPTTPQ